MAYVPNREQLAWAAGFIDGEGCIRLSWHTNGKENYNPSSERIYPRSIIDVSQKVREPLDQLQRIFGGVGNVYQRKQVEGRPTAEYSYMIRRREHVAFVLAMTWPWLTVKKQDALTLLVDLNNYYQRGTVRRWTHRYRPKVAN